MARAQFGRAVPSALAERSVFSFCFRAVFRAVHAASFNGETVSKAIAAVLIPRMSRAGWLGTGAAELCGATRWRRTGTAGAEAGHMRSSGGQPSCPAACRELLSLGFGLLVGHADSWGMPGNVV